MKKNLLRCFVYILILTFTVSATPLCANAADILSSPSASSKSYEKAIDLKILGLVANTPGNFQLDRAPTRTEGAVMLIRLLGKEAQVLKGTYKHPFTDVHAWADKYIGYMYENKLTIGIDETHFGSDLKLSASQYVTFVLRSLGYQDGVDFNYSQAIDKALALGIVSSAEAVALKSPTAFLRDDMFSISHNALSAALKGSSATLLDKLADADKAIFKPAATALGLYTSDVKKEYANISTLTLPSTAYGIEVKNSEDFFKVVRYGLCNFESSLTLDIRNYSGSYKDDFSSIYDRARIAAEDFTKVKSYSTRLKYSANSMRMVLTFEYKYSKDEFKKRLENVRAALKKARYVVANLITSGMGDFEKELILHDYIVNNVRYDIENEQKDTIPDYSFEEYGTLVLGVAVCEGYSRAMKLMCDLSGIECIIVTGSSITRGVQEGHAWNIVKIDGEYYHLDVTYDDPVTEDGSNAIIHDYFNLSDSEMALYCKWDTTAYPACTSTKNSYFTKYNMVARDKDAFSKAVLDGFEKRRSKIELKVIDYSHNNYTSSDIYDIVLLSKDVTGYRYSINDTIGVIRIFNIKYS
jgi:hypothetical protein